MTRFTLAAASVAVAAAALAACRTPASSGADQAPLPSLSAANPAQAGTPAPRDSSASASAPAPAGKWLDAQCGARDVASRHEADITATVRVTDAAGCRLYQCRFVEGGLAMTSAEAIAKCREDVDKAKPPID